MTMPKQPAVSLLWQFLAGTHAHNTCVTILAAYDHTVCFYNNIQDSYKDECKYLVLRCTAAFFGTLTGSSAAVRAHIFCSLHAPHTSPLPAFFTHRFLQPL